MAYRFDEDLEFLRYMQSADLDTLVEILTGKDKSNATENLSQQSGYKRHYPNHIKYVDEIMEELQLFGGNTFVNLIRRQGVPYKEILCNVCDKMKVNYNKNSSVERIEGELLLKFLKQAIDEMDEQTLKDLLKDTKINTTNGFSKQAAFAAIQSAILAGSFASYQFAAIIANAAAMQTIGSGLSIATNIMLTRAVSVFAGILGSISALWMGYIITGPAYRITMPAVIQVAYLRLRHSNTYNVFLTGEMGVGKDTIFHILKEGKFTNTHKATGKIHKYYFDSGIKTLSVINTAGAMDNDEENREARRDLKSGTQYVYVFKADDYLTNQKIKKQVDLALDTHKEICEKKKCTLKIIGTHKDECLKRGISEDEIQKLESWLGEKGKCQILDLTQFSGEQKQQELCDFITD